MWSETGMDYHQELISKLKEIQDQSARSMSNRALIMEYLNDEILDGIELPQEEYTKLNRTFRKYKVWQVLECIDIGADQYLDLDNNGNLTDDSIMLFLEKLGGILYRKYPPAGSNTNRNEKQNTKPKPDTDKINNQINIVVNSLERITEYCNVIIKGLIAISTRQPEIHFRDGVPLIFMAQLLLDYISFQIHTMTSDEFKDIDNEEMYGLYEPIPPSLGILDDDIQTLDETAKRSVWLYSEEAILRWMNWLNFADLGVNDVIEGYKIAQMVKKEIYDKYHIETQFSLQ